MTETLQNSKFKVQTSKGPQGLASKSTFDLEERTFKLGESIVGFCRQLKTDHVSRPLVAQLVRSGTSIGANYSEANNASSRKDFRNKVHIAKKEAQETKYWLRMLKTCYPEQQEALRRLWKETHEITLILQSIVTKVSTKDTK